MLSAKFKSVKVSFLFVRLWNAFISYSVRYCTSLFVCRIKTGQSSFEWQVVLCDDRDALARSAIYGVIVPVVLFQLGTKVRALY